MRNKSLVKKIILIGIVCILSVSLQAQPGNTRWKATLIIGNPINAILDFKKDTVSLYTVADSTMIETMTYTGNDTLFTLLKVDGQSDCDNSTPGKYRFEIKGDSMWLKMIADDCNDRSSVINNTKWTKWKEYHEVKIGEAILKQYVGVYELDDAHPITVSLENGRLYAEGPNNRLPKSPLISVTDTKFFLRIAGVEWDFVKNATGNVIALISHEEKDYQLKKVK